MLKEYLKTKGFYIAFATGILAIFVIVYTVRGVQSAGEKLSELNETKEQLEQESTNELSSNYEISQENEEIQANSETKTESKNEENTQFTDNSDIAQEKNMDEDTDISQENSMDSGAELESEFVSADDKNISGDQNADDKDTESKDATDEETKSVMNYNNIIAKLQFNQDIGLLWPVKGNIIKNYSEDKLIYFPTLEQFKYNTGVFIEAKAGQDVVNSYDGLVTGIINDKEFGQMIQISIGENYVVTYGQLDEVYVAEGDMVKQGDAVGCVAEPTSYYTEEGTHIYMKVEENGEPVNPLLFLQ